MGAEPRSRAARRIVLCADDYALSESVSRGIEALAAAARLSAASVMVLSPRWPQDAPVLRALRLQHPIDVGLHLDWTSPFACAAGHGLPLERAMLRALAGGFDRATARAVIERQLDAFEAHWGGPPDHVDGHQHVQQFAGIREALVQALAARYSARPPWLRISEAPPALRDVKSRAIAALGARRLRALAAQAGMPVVRWLAGVSDFSGGEAGFAARMHRWIAGAEDGTVLMCHPGASGFAHDRDDGIAAAREAEFHWLASDAAGLALGAPGLALVRGLEAALPTAHTVNPAAAPDASPPS